MLLERPGGSTLPTGIAEAIRKNSRETFRQRAIETLRVDKRQHLQSVACPVLCLHGRHDRLVKPKFAREICTLHPTCEMVWFDTGHLILETRPERAAAIIARFCAAL